MPGKSQTKHSIKTGAVLVVLMASAGCMVGPRYQRPLVPSAPAFKEAPTRDSGTGNPIAYGNWWLVFHDDDLNRLEQQTDLTNQDVRAAMARVDQAQEFLRASRSYLFPTVSIGGSASRNREAQNRPNNGNTGGHAATYNDFQLSMLLGYEVDVWGKLRHSVEAAAAAEQSQEANLHFVRLVAETGLAMNYFGVRELDAEHDVLLATLEALRQAEQLTELRMKGGLATDYDVYQAKTLLDQTAAQAQHIDIQRAQLEHVIAVLTGQSPSSFFLPRNALQGTPPSIPAGLPSQLLERRPDIRSLERTLAVSNAQIGIARAAQFPQFSLSGAAGFESVSPAALFQWQNSLASLGGGALAPVFTAGRLKAQVEQSKASYRETVSQYEQSVLTAYQQVEDQLAAIRILAGEAASEENAVNDAQRVAQISLNQYKAGLANYLNVVDAQTELLYNQRTQTQILGQQMIASVALIKALGGGWLNVQNPAPTTP